MHRSLSLSLTLLIALGVATVAAAATLEPDFGGLASTALPATAVASAVTFSSEVEPGEHVRLEGRVEGAGDEASIRAADGATYPLIGWTGNPGQVSGLEVVAVLVPTPEGGMGLGFQIEGPAPEPEPRTVLAEVREGLGSLLAALTGRRAAQTPRPPVVFPDPVRTEGQAFLAAFHAYVVAVNGTLAELLAKKPVDADAAKSSEAAWAAIERVSRQAHQRHEALFAVALRTQAAYVARVRSSGLLKSVARDKTWVLIDKREFLVSVIDRATGRALFVTPTSYGANPTGGPKRRSGDLRSPENPPGTFNPDVTPLSIGRRVPSTVKAGMTIRCMEVTSRRPEDRYWATPRTINVALHGAPATWSMGKRLSHGCFRIQEEQVATLYDLTVSGTPLVILGI